MATVAQDPPLLTIPAVADRLAISEKTVRRLVSAGILPAVRVSAGAIRIDADELDEWIDYRRLPNVSGDGSRNTGQLRADANPDERRAPDSQSAVEARPPPGGDPTERSTTP